jgi:hypothetical protein
MPLTELVYWVTVALAMTQQADQRIRINAPARSTALMQAFLAKRSNTQVCQQSYSPDLVPCDLWLFPKPKSWLKVGRFVNATVTQYISSVSGVSLLTD